MVGESEQSKRSRDQRNRVGTNSIQSPAKHSAALEEHGARRCRRHHLPLHRTTSRRGQHGDRPRAPDTQAYVDRSDEDWVEEGLQIPLEYQPLDAPVAKRVIPLDVRLRARTPAGPFDKNGDISQGYLFPVGVELQETLQGLAGVAPRDVEELIEEELAVEGPTDVERVTYGRAEQRALRKLLLRGRDQAECGLCGQTTSAKYLVAAHKTPPRLHRRRTTRPERCNARLPYGMRCSIRER